MMFEKVKKIWDSLDKVVRVNQRELVLGITAFTLAGLVTGMLCSPRKQVTIGSNNGSHNSDNGNNNTGKPLADETEPDTDD